MILFFPVHEDVPWSISLICRMISALRMALLSSPTSLNLPNSTVVEDAGDVTAETSIKDALQSLPLFDDLFLSMQALNLDIVDGFIEQMETDLLREYMELERTPVQSATLVSAISQLWVFGLYELLRTWRQRVKEVIWFADELRNYDKSEREKRIGPSWLALF
jgi:hypothetical protein